jgi:PiT family inorganic phosphate transporter
MFSLAGGLYLGWALGANDASNVFGTAVASRIVGFWRAAVICALAILAGAVLQGYGGIHTLSGLAVQTKTTVLIISIAAAITVTLMTIFRLPISTSQAMVGAIAGIGLSTNSMRWQGLIKVVVCWISTPIGAMAVSLVLYWIYRSILKILSISILTRDKLLWGGLILVGVYGSYALGANNVANATGIYSGQIPGLSDRLLALIGGGAIALGVLTYSRRVMLAVGSGIMKLDAFTALVAVSSMAMTTHVFALIGVPVSTSQAIVGAIIGVGMIHGVQNLRLSVLRNIAVGWLLTPIVAFILASAGYALFAGT